MVRSKGLWVLAMALGAVSAQAVFYDYVDWTTMSAGNPGSMTGTVGGIGVTYSGEVDPGSQISGGTDWWNPASPTTYLSAQVSNAPGTTDIVIVDSVSSGNTVTFAQAVTNPIMAFVSVGQVGLPVSYTFDQAFTILSQGAGHWGGTSTSFTQSGNTLTGAEGHGTIMFLGTFTTLRFDISPAEHWHGFTFGVQSVPEPFTMGLGAAGVALAVRRLRRRRPAYGKRRK